MYLESPACLVSLLFGLKVSAAFNMDCEIQYKKNEKLQFEKINPVSLRVKNSTLLFLPLSC